MKESKLNVENEKIKEDYEQYLLHLRVPKLRQSTVDDKISSICMFDELMNHKISYKDYTADLGIEFYESLKNKDIELTTVFKHLSNLKEFLEWLFINKKVQNAKQKLELLRVLDPKDEDKRLAIRTTFVEYPTLEEFQKIISFEEKTVIDKRDKAILSFLFISCARIGAVATTTIDLVDLEKMIYNQDPLEGVKTKRQKYIITKLLPFDETYYSILKDWVNCLKTEYSFEDKDPLFPKIRKYSGGIEVYKKFMDGESEYNKMLEKRCINAGCQKYNPHAFRHFGIHQALKYVRTGTQLKALSQNVGHEDICTILEQYAKMTPDIYTELLDRMITVKPENKTVDEYTNEELLEILKQRLSVENNY